MWKMCAILDKSIISQYSCSKAMTLQDSSGPLGGHPCVPATTLMNISSDTHKWEMSRRAQKQRSQWQKTVIRLLKSSSFPTHMLLPAQKVAVIGSGWLKSSKPIAWLVRIRLMAMESRFLAITVSWEVSAWRVRLYTTKTHHVFKLSKKPTFFYKEAVVYPFVQIETRKNSYLLSNEEHIVVENYITASGLSHIY